MLTEAEGDKQTDCDMCVGDKHFFLSFHKALAEKIKKQCVSVFAATAGGGTIVVFVQVTPNFTAVGDIGAASPKKWNDITQHAATAAKTQEWDKTSSAMAKSAALQHG